MARILTGIQSTGIPHLGNILGAIKPAIELSQQAGNESFLFIADLHALTQVKDGKLLREQTLQTAAAWLSLGLDPEKTFFYRQSEVPQVTELAWYLLCFFPFSRLELAHSFKDKADRLEDVNGGLFTYPMLMAADIILYDAEKVPVGKDQLQHLEMARDVVKRFHHLMGDTFVMPEAMINEDTQYILGVDGHKMSKSRDNTINIFQADKPLRKEIMRIVTDDAPLEAPKKPDENTIFNIYKTMASDEQVEEMRQNFLAGGYGYGHAKQALYELIIDQFGEARAAYDEWMAQPEKIKEVLADGAEKAAKIADKKLKEVREKLGY